MISRLRCACVAAALMGLLVLSASVAAKPPDLPEDGTFTAAPDATPHKDGDVACPYLRQKMSDRPDGQVGSLQMGPDVIENLKRLKRADKLLERAKKLARDGLIAEAMECCVRAAKLCPGSPCANRATDTLFALAFGCPIAPGASEEASEMLHEDLPEKTVPVIDYEFEVGANNDGGLRMGADCSVGGNVYHLRYKHGCLSIWKTGDAAKTKP